MSKPKFKVGDTVICNDGRDVDFGNKYLIYHVGNNTNDYIIDHLGANGIGKRFRATVKEVDAKCVIVRDFGDEHSSYTFTLPDGCSIDESRLIDEAMRKVEIRKEMNIKEFFKPVAHKNVWAIKQPKGDK